LDALLRGSTREMASRTRCRDDDDDEEDAGPLAEPALFGVVEEAPAEAPEPPAERDPPAEACASAS
jgi:hypothetical protein